MDITVPDASQDAVYQQQIAQFAQQLTDYQAAQDLATQQYNAQYDTNLNRLGWNDKTGWDQAQNGVTSYAKDFNNDTGDFAGRGAYWSGAYANSIGDLTNQYNQQKSDLATGKQNYGDTQLQALTGYQDANTQSQQAALSDATARIAAKYGIDAAQVPVSGGAKKMTVPVNTASGA
jgi:hypothetical protein